MALHALRRALSTSQLSGFSSGHHPMHGRQLHSLGMNSIIWSGLPGVEESSSERGNDSCDNSRMTDQATTSGSAWEEQRAFSGRKVPYWHYTMTGGYHSGFSKEAFSSVPFQQGTVAWLSVAGSSGYATRALPNGRYGVVNEAGTSQQGHQERGGREGNYQGGRNHGVCAYVKGTPHNVFASDLARFFSEFGVDESRVHPVYDDNYKAHGWYVEFPSHKDFSAGNLKTLEVVLGARPIRLEERGRQYMEESIRRNQVQDWRGKSVIVSHLPWEADEESLERFFHGYSIAGNGIKFFKTQPEERKNSDTNEEPKAEVRAVVKFTTGLEAMRAWREKHLEIVNKRSVRVSLVK